MKPIEKYFPVLQKGWDQHLKNHPHWQIEILVSIIKRSLMRLKDCIEDVRDLQITWDNRRNGHRSTGPKTANGNAVSKLNALKHGLRAREVVPAGADVSRKVR